MQREQDEIAVLAQRVADALNVPIGGKIGPITDALLEIQRRTYEHAADLVERQPDSINKIRALAKAATEAQTP
jgi:hypothetical protein